MIIIIIFLSITSSKTISTNLFYLKSGNTCSCEYLNETRDGTLLYKFDITRDNRNSEKCNIPCFGDPDERCGGHLHFSLYRSKAI